MDTQNILQEKRKFNLFSNDIPVTQSSIDTIKAIIATTKPIGNDTDNPIYYASLSNGKSSINKEDLSVINDDIFSPVTSVVLDAEIMNIGILLVAKTKKPLINVERLQFNYQFVLGDFGLPQLNIYVSFNEAHSPEMPVYWDNTFQIVVNKNISQDIDLNEIVTVQVFLVDDDPRTTRGTVTTVKRPM
ncbi:hypothetical protein [Kordia sp.]|uniref:hypothetical protein n=1 Tax=Kordia sp. TaxID=1965332 RepID=UPI003B5BD156